MDYNLAEYKCVWKNPHNSKIYAAEWYTLSGKQNYQKTTQAVTYSMFNFTINKFNFPVHTKKTHAVTEENLQRRALTHTNYMTKASQDLLLSCTIF